MKNFSLLLFWMTLVPVFNFLRADIVVYSDLSHEYSVSQGDTVSRTIAIENSDSLNVQGVRIYQTDFFYQSNGQRSYTDPGLLTRSNANWIRYSPQQIYMQPNTKSDINYEVHIPATAAPGTYWSVLMIEPIVDFDPNEQPDRFTLYTVIRHAIQIITTVGDEKIMTLVFEDAQLVRTNKGLSFQVDISNNGNCLAKPDIWIEIFSKDGTRVDKFTTDKGKLLPGTSIRRTFDVSTLEIGEYEAIIVADCGDEDIFGMNVSIVVEPSPENP